MAVLGEKLRQVPQATQPGWEVESGALFLESSKSIQLYWVSVKGCHVRGPPVGSVRRAYMDWRGIRGVIIGFSPAGCTSIRIAATLRYE
jgi:hypothetical protein